MIEITENHLKIYINDPLIRTFYLNFIKENIILIQNLFNENYSELRDSPINGCDLNKCRARHLQIMTILSASVEYALKIILLKKGYVLQRNSGRHKYPLNFISKVELFNRYCEEHSCLIEEDLDDLYYEAESYINENVEQRLILFDECKKNYMQEIFPSTHFRNVREIDIEETWDLYSQSYLANHSFFGYRKISPEIFLEIIQKVRNSYIHNPLPLNEPDFIMIYLINCLIFILKEEFPNFFSNLEYIGEDCDKKYFKMNFPERITIPFYIFDI